MDLGAGRVSLAAVLMLMGCRPAVGSEQPGSEASGGFVEAEGAEPAPLPEPQPINCERPVEFGPVLVDAEQYARRYAATASRFAQVQSTKEQPAEECGIAAGVELLLALTCEDGSRPFASFNQAHASRRGNVGAGGRCGSIIDLYEVPCPEGTYEIFIDSYICADLAMFR